MSKQPIRILIVDDHEAVRASIVHLLAVEPDMQVVGTAVDGREAINAAKETEPDVIVMDISMPELDGIRAAGQIRDLDISSRIIMLSMHYNNVLVQQARKSGAKGYITKERANSDLVPAIRAAYNGALTL